MYKVQSTMGYKRGEKRIKDKVQRRTGRETVQCTMYKVQWKKEERIERVDRIERKARGKMDNGKRITEKEKQFQVTGFRIQEIPGSRIKCGMTKQMHPPEADLRESERNMYNVGEGWCWKSA